MLLITDYHEHGSLYDFLQDHAFTPQMLKTFALSLSSGLAHLHTEIYGTPGKPAISHRDIKSKNLLVKNNGQCAIADFGLAVKYTSESDELQIASNTRVGTIRNMPPEALDESMDSKSFEAFKMADMYSFSLVLWEMCRRCIVTSPSNKNSTCQEHVMPYYDVVSSDPSINDMYEVVCLKEIRPTVSETWQTEDILAILSKIMQECWHKNPSCRLTALRVKKTLNKLDTDLKTSLV